MNVLISEVIVFEADSQYSTKLIYELLVLYYNSQALVIHKTSLSSSTERTKQKNTDEEMKKEIASALNCDEEMSNNIIYWKTNTKISHSVRIFQHRKSV